MCLSLLYTTKETTNKMSKIALSISDPSLQLRGPDSPAGIQTLTVSSSTTKLDSFRIPPHHNPKGDSPNDPQPPHRRHRSPSHRCLPSRRSSRKTRRSKCNPAQRESPSPDPEIVERQTIHALSRRPARAHHAQSNCRAAHCSPLAHPSLPQRRLRPLRIADPARQGQRPKRSSSIKARP